MLQQLGLQACRVKIRRAIFNRGNLPTHRRQNCAIARRFITLAVLICSLTGPAQAKVCHLLFHGEPNDLISTNVVAQEALAVWREERLHPLSPRGPTADLLSLSHLTSADYAIAPQLHRELNLAGLSLSFVDSLIQNQKGNLQVEQHSPTIGAGEGRQLWSLARSPNADDMLRLTWVFDSSNGYKTESKPTLVEIRPATPLMEKYYYARNVEQNQVENFTFTLNKKAIQGYSQIFIPASVLVKLDYKHSVTAREVVQAFVHRDVRNPLIANKNPQYDCCSSYFFYSKVDGHRLKVFFNLETHNKRIVVLTAFAAPDSSPRTTSNRYLH